MDNPMKMYMAILALAFQASSLQASATKLDNVDYEDAGCETKDFSCPKERLAVTDHLAGRYSAGEKWLKENSEEIEQHIDAIRILSGELLLAERQDTIDSLNYRINLTKEKINKIAEPVRKVFREVSVKMTQNETDEEYMKFHRYCFKLGNENFMRHYDVCGMQKLGEKFHKMSIKKGGQKYAAQATYYRDTLDKYRNYDRYIASRLADYRGINDRLIGIPYQSVIGTPSYWLDQMAGPFKRYAFAVSRYLQIFEGIENKKSEMRDKKLRASRISAEKKQIVRHLHRQKVFIESLGNQISALQDKITSGQNEKAKTIESLASLYNTITPKTSMGFISSESHTYDRNRLLNVNDKAFSIPSHARYVQISANRRLIYKANGFWRLNRADFPGLLGEFSTMNGYLETYLNHPQIPNVKEPIGALLATMPNGAKINVGTGGIAALPDNSTGGKFSLVINDYQKGLARGDCPNPLAADKRCFAISGGPVIFTAKYFSKADEIYPKVLAYLKDNLDSIVASKLNSKDPFGNTRDAVLLAIKDYTDDITPFLPIINHTLAIKLIDRKTKDQSVKLDSMLADKVIVESKILAAKQEIEELEGALNASDDDLSKIEAIVTNYYAKKLALEKISLYKSLRNFAEYSSYYIDALIYRDPSDKKSFKRYLDIQQMVSAFLKGSRHLDSSDTIKNRSVDYIRQSLCAPIGFVSEDAIDICTEFDGEVKAERIKNALAEFFIAQDKKWQEDKIFNPESLLHCQIHLGATAGKGKRYLNRQFKVETVQELWLDDAGASEFYVPKDFDSPKFSIDSACSFVDEGSRPSCIKNRSQAEIYLEELEGYYEFPFQTIKGKIDSRFDNLKCRAAEEKSLKAKNTFLIGAAVEWNAQRKDKVFANYSSTAILQKGDKTWFDMDIDGETAIKTIHAQVAGLPKGSSSMTEQPIKIVETSYLKDPSIDGTKCPSYSDPQCAMKILGRKSINPSAGGSYRYKTTFLNSWYNNNWVLRVPIYSGPGRDSYNKAMLDQLNDLKLHFYFMAN